jgi:hypothetical protein
MPYRLIKYADIDLTMLVLNTTSVGVLALNWFSEHITGVGGFLVMLSVAALNFAKAYSTIKHKKK